MRAALMVLLLFAALVATAKATPDKADHILIEKAERRMTLTRGGETLKTYRIAPGSSPVGDQEKQGDGRTTERSYRISCKNPHSKFHLSLKISYPDRADRAAARRRGAPASIRAATSSSTARPGRAAYRPRLSCGATGRSAASPFQMTRSKKSGASSMWGRRSRSGRRLRRAQLNRTSLPGRSSVT